VNSEEWERIKEIFASALEQDPSRRAEFLRRACSGDDAVRAELESLLSRNLDLPDIVWNRLRRWCGSLRTPPRLFEQKPGRAIRLPLGRFDIAPLG